MDKVFSSKLQFHRHLGVTWYLVIRKWMSAESSLIQVSNGHLNWRMWEKGPTQQGLEYFNKSSINLQKSKLSYLITTCYYSVLYCSANMWMLPNLFTIHKKKLMLSHCLKNSVKNYERMQSFEKLHYMAKQATPEMMLKYRHALLLDITFIDINHRDPIQISYTIPKLLNNTSTIPHNYFTCKKLI